MNHIRIPKAQYRRSALSQPLRPLLIAHSLLRMLTTIQFDYKTQGGSIEIENKVARGVLPSEIHAKLPVAQLLPEPHFHIG